MASRCQWVVEIYSDEAPEWQAVGEWFFFRSCADVPMRTSSFQRCINGVKRWYDMGCAAEGEYLRIKHVESGDTIPFEALGL